MNSVRRTWSIANASRALRKGGLSVAELLAEISTHRNDTDGRVHAWAHVGTSELQTALAVRLQSELTDSTSQLTGVPFGVKDMIDTADMPTEGGSKVLQGRQPDVDAACVTAVIDRGGLLIGKTHTHEFAFGVRTPQCKNPWDETRTTGGSSGGSAAAVAAGHVPWAYGTDTLGSVRMPAALCGVVGLKPTTGSISSQGVLPLSQTMDSVGFLTRTVEDAHILMTELGAGYAQLPADRDLRIGFLKPESAGHVEDGIWAILQSAEQPLARASTVSDIDLDITTHVAVGFDIMLPEAAAWHRRYLDQTAPPYDPAILDALRAGLDFRALDYLDALESRRRIQATYRKIFESVDVLVTPTTPYVAPLTTAPGIDWPDGTSEPLETSMCRFTAAASVAGLPAISVPVGLANGLPVGAQIIAPWHRDADALHVARMLETPLQ